MKTKKTALTKKPLLLAAVIGLLGGVLSAALLMILPGLTPAPTTPGVSSGKALIGGPFSLLDETGKRVSDKDFAGRPMLVYFGFTSCPDICPSGLQVIAAALDKLGAKADGITPIFISVDPERDTPEVLGAYVKSFGPRIRGLTGTPEDIANVVKAYRVYARKVPDEKTGSYSVDHSSFMYLMNGKGEFVRHFPHTVQVEDLADGLAKAL